MRSDNYVFISGRYAKKDKEIVDQLLSDYNHGKAYGIILKAERDNTPIDDDVDGCNLVHVNEKDFILTLTKDKTKDKEFFIYLYRTDGEILKSSLTDLLELSNDGSYDNAMIADTIEKTLEKLKQDADPKRLTYDFPEYDFNPTAMVVTTITDVFKTMHMDSHSPDSPKYIDALEKVSNLIRDSLEVTFKLKWPDLLVLPIQAIRKDQVNDIILKWLKTHLS